MHTPANPAQTFATASSMGTSAALIAIRNPHASVDILAAALGSVDAEIRNAEALVDEIEKRRQRLLLAGDQSALDRLERQITVANRNVEALVAAKRALPDLIALRKDTEAALAKRIAKANAMAQSALGQFQQIHKLATELAQLLELVRQADGEVAATEADCQAAGLRHGLKTPLTLLAENVGCRIADLPSTDGWVIRGYLGSQAPYLLDGNATPNGKRS